MGVFLSTEASTFLRLSTGRYGNAVLRQPRPGAGEANVARIGGGRGAGALDMHSMLDSYNTHFRSAEARIQGHQTEQANLQQAIAEVRLALQSENEKKTALESECEEVMADIAQMETLVSTREEEDAKIKDAISTMKEEYEQLVESINATRKDFVQECWRLDDELRCDYVKLDPG
ncbi:hypothetical protein BSKO_11234 [Bryopsis sp. KO-2023]|nr:hypothetical protein BSKO_11234 [Bryopsis sp. KO-2023]